ncbi:MAG: glycosyltransferase family 1 protein [Bacteroidales bacterium]|nr:glycosyltransferase family 1 protein [Bacteroidales bacterium]
MLYINGRYLSQKLTGVNRFAYEICNALASLNAEFIIIAPKMISKEYDVSKFNIKHWGVGKSHFWEQISLPLFFTFKRKYLLINFTGLGSLLLKKQIITIHDMSFWRHPEWFSKKYYLYYKFFRPLIVKNIFHILTLSEFSRREIIDCLNVPSDNISIVNCAVSSSFINSQIIEGHFENNEFILTVSSIEPRKNLSRLLEAMELLNNDIKLLIIGSSNPVFSELNLKSSEKVFFLGRVSDQQLKWYYSNAKLFIYPSVYEGFGLPPLEAMSMGCPTAVSDIDVFHEVFDDASLFFDPYDITDIANCLNELLNSTIIRKELILKGFNQVSKYNWINSANIILNIVRMYEL